MNRHLYDEEALMKDYPLAARTAHPEGTVIPVGSAAIGGENLTLIAGRAPWKAGSSCLPPRPR